jgi:short-subunit dehydrogenase
LIIGASAGLGRALAEEAALRGHDVMLVASDTRDLSAAASDLRLRFGIRAEYEVCHFGEPGAAERALAAARKFGVVQIVLFPIGAASERDTDALDATTINQLIRINFSVPVEITTALWQELKQSRGYIVGFGSVAAVRGRNKNMVYAAAKRALLSFFESLRFLACDTGVHVHFYQVGYLETQQTFGKRLLLPKARPSALAQLVFDRLDREEGSIYYPRFWSVIAVILRLLPWRIFSRMQI